MAIKEETIKICVCDRCHYEWKPRDGIEPRVCPQCKSYKWNNNKL